ncbi:hypothetical protein IQ215_13720 [Cyanobacterium stanieri LEGE 03274]|uniref:Uncharacterized protein n=1 Tax=Cyanobacterium stanieri LEGE 03274 TaxID=1828756 RepID=A0ABR9V7C2_9CHRO|nr:hypothetical protein [Cyanobacterium stanieri]MBE9223757.1 hypothetical protein [Cyanobacterium stanieri LEGE 03274]
MNNKIKILRDSDKLISASFSGDKLNLLLEREGEYYLYAITPDENSIPRISSWLITKGQDEIEFDVKIDNPDEPSGEVDSGDSNVHVRTF